MRFLYNRPIDQTISELWNSIDGAYKKAFFFVVGMNLLAFGFEMTNLTIHHDDIWQIFIRDDIIGHYLGRFGLGWLHYRMQNAHIMPFLQMFEGIVFMTVYGLVISRLWGLRRTADIVIVSSIVCVFPFVAQMYSYNALTALYPIAHLLSAIAVLLSTRATLVHIAIASLLYTAAFSIYQSVIANAATIFVFWVLSTLLFTSKPDDFTIKTIVKPLLAACVSVFSGGLLYVTVVWFLNIDFGSYQDAGEAFSLQHGFNPSYAITEVIKGTRSFFFWPEHYFPDFLKKLQLVFLATAGILCLWIPKGLPIKIAAAVIFLLTFLTPRILQLIHPEGIYHNLTLTAYAVTIAGFVMMVFRAKYILVRNLSIIFAAILVGGYIIQCSWVSTVNYLNTLAHYTTLTQVLARVRSLPEEWDGEKVVVVGNYKMKQDYPYKVTTGVATNYIGTEFTEHMNQLARLMRDEVIFVPADQTTPEALEYARTYSAWPHSTSVGVVDGVGVVVFSNDDLKPGAQQLERVY
jgi:hypothetical protein